MNFSSIRSPNDAVVSGVVSPARAAVIAAVLALAPLARADDPAKPAAIPTDQPVQLSPLVVSATPTTENHLTVPDWPPLCCSTSDAASLLQNLPGVSFYSGGGVSSLPVIDGLADDQLHILVDGLQSTPACANHMNPPLSYVAPSKVGSVQVFAGITPVSIGGDSIGGTILVNSAAPEFARSGQGSLIEGQASTFYRSNGNAKGANLAATVADQNLSLTYEGSTAEAGDYKNGHGDTVTSTYYKSSNQELTAAAKANGNQIVVKVGQQFIPRQGFANEQMDMVSNRATFVNLDYMGSFDWGTLEASAFWQNTRHEMDLGEDKLTFPMPMIMPMDAHGKDLGYSLKAEIPLTQKDTLRLGNEFHGFTLNDWWPPVAGTAPMMAPDTFESINNGHRDVFSFFAEWESKWSQQLTTLLGIRNETVQMNAGNVQGYSTDPIGGYVADATAFDEQDHARHDDNWDLTALVRYEPDSNSTYEAGYALKTESPNLYERYAWSTNLMASGMINWFGDGNYYVGNLDLKPETAHTLSVTADWHDSARKNWEIKVTPYYTYVQDYIGVNVIGTSTYGDSTFNQLQFANHNAELYGLDVSGLVGLWNSNSFGTGQFKGTMGYVRGETLDTGDSLYHLMPLNARLALEQKVSGWTNTIEWQLVDRKSRVDPLRYEPVTGGYGLVNLRTGYAWKSVRVDLGVTNLFNKFYSLPLGGVNFDDYLASGWMGKIAPLAGQGRSVDASITVKF
jgi:iron complex outermembrane receptor protein